jgi:transcriptional regulator with XRE-family HTH domain
MHLPQHASQIGQALRAARERARLTQAEAARLLGVDKQTISRWERGETAVKAADHNRALERYGAADGGRLDTVGSNVSRGTSPALARFAPAVDRFEREIIRLGADDDEVDRIRAILRAPPVTGVLVAGSPEEQDAEFDIFLEACRVWLKLHMQRRGLDTRPSYVRAAESHGREVISGSATPPGKKTLASKRVAGGRQGRR